MLHKRSTSKHKLVVLGDSIGQGFQNGGVYRTDLNFPSFLSDSLDPESKFDQPVFTAQAGIPLNLEVLVRGLCEEYGNTLEWNEYLPAMHHLYKTLKRVKNYWEGNFKKLSTCHTTPYHNQSVWGFSVNDAWMMTEATSKKFIDTRPDTYSVFDVLPDHAMYITARMVLNPSFSNDFSDYTLLDNINYLQQNGGIENLIVTMGHNNIIGAVTDLKFKYSEPDDLETLPPDRNCTVYRPAHFQKEFRKLAKKVARIGAERVITQTIPYVTIPPVTRGINEDKTLTNVGYFDYYTRFWVWDDDFHPDRHPHLTKKEAIKLDQTVDEYNKIIRDTAEEYGWLVVPLNKYVSAIARRRRGGTIKIPYPEAFCKAMKKNEATAHLVDGNGLPRLSTDYLRIDRGTGRIFKGGIFSLDGIHPTTIGYGLIAHVYYKTMQENGIVFQKPLDWDSIIENDTLVTDPPYLLVELKNLLRFLSQQRKKKFSIIGSGLLHQLMKLISPRRSP